MWGLIASIIGLLIAIQYFFMMNPSSSQSSSQSSQMGGASRKHKLSYKHHRRHR